MLKNYHILLVVISYKICIFILYLLCQPINSQALIFNILYIYIYRENLFYIISQKNSGHLESLTQHSLRTAALQTAKSWLIRAWLLLNSFPGRPNVFLHLYHFGILTNTISLPALFKALAKAFSWKKKRENFAVQPNPQSILVLLPVRAQITKT